MPGAIRFGRFGDTTIRVHASFLPVILWAAWLGALRYGSFGGATFGAVMVVLLFLCVLAHELAHSLQATASGIKVYDILLLPVGGWAMLDAARLDPYDEVRIALVGPLANLALAVLCGGLIFFLWSGAKLDANTLLLRQPSPFSLFVFLGLANLMLGLFNFLPAFPLDGGRALRAFLSARMHYEVATHHAAQIGRAFGIGVAVIGLFLAVAGFLTYGGALVFVGASLYTGALYEDRLVMRNARLNRWKVEDVMQLPLQTLSPQESLSTAITFLARGDVIPVVVGKPARLVGLVLAGELRAKASSSLSVAHVMQTRFPTVRASDPLWIAHEKLRRFRMRAIPVVNRDTLCGLVTLADIQQTLREGIPPEQSGIRPGVEKIV